MAASSAPPAGHESRFLALSALALRLWSQPRSRSVVLYALVALMLLFVSVVPGTEDSLLARLERAAFDTQMHVLRERWPRPLDNDVVLVGIDDRSEEVFTEPIALWHMHLARLLGALGEAKPRAVGIDVVPPHCPGLRLE